MTSTTITSPAPARARPLRVATPGRLALTTLHLLAMGVIGVIAFTVLVTLLSTGLGLLPVLGIGLVVLVAFEYCLYALSWLETARIDGLYGFGLPPRRVRTSGQPGFTGFLRTLWLQLIDPMMWRAIANAVIATLLGWLAWVFLSSFASGIAFAFSPLFGDNQGSVQLWGIQMNEPGAPLVVLVGILAAVVSLAALVGLAAVHGVISRAVMVPSREALLADEARRSQQQRAGAVRAADVERHRIERDLHDGIQPRLVSVAMTLGMAQQKIDTDPAAAKELVSEAHTSTKAAITELRQLARGIHTSVLDDRGLDAALSAIASRSHIPVQLDVRLTTRCRPEVEAAVYFVIAEALTNAAKHSRASEVRVIVRQREDGTVWARVEDNGIGGATVTAGGGLDGLENRVLGVGGTLRIDSPVGGPSTVEVSVPCAS
ncbi:histidine kinase [Microbacterium mangrovi]|uniref:histidine kinase n=1 Tax=Microbacterium mangrovi TaxID=1348253 RepID=A0A0B1ZXB5_9MICO|nr:histidine kinase [Microbacterium mangrovi]KHK95384.1 histidine kinase [Microbacterium mangrovi]